jgi:hypothetical protein
MTEDTNAKLETWWAGLTDEQRAELLPLQQGDVLPGGYVVGLTDALGIGPAGTKWESDPGDFTFHVDSRLGPFLDSKRD